MPLVEPNVALADYSEGLFAMATTAAMNERNRKPQARHNFQYARTFYL